jgi:hypothetical protein
VALDRAHLEERFTSGRKTSSLLGPSRTNMRGPRTWRRTVEEETGKWERPGKKLQPWPKTESAVDASWKPCAPEDVKGNKSIVSRALWLQYVLLAREVTTSLAKTVCSVMAHPRFVSIANNESAGC